MEGNAVNRDLAPTLNYSWRNASMGSRREARRAGM
jgi:hypothetical protein